MRVNIIHGFAHAYPPGRRPRRPRRHRRRFGSSLQRHVARLRAAQLDNALYGGEARKRTSARTTIGSARRRLRQAQDVVRGDRALELGLRVPAIARPLTASVGPALVCLLCGGLGWALPSPGAHKHLLVSTRSEAHARAMITAGASQQERSPGQSCKARSGGPAAGKAVRTARQVSHRNRLHRRPRFRRRPRLRRRRCFHSQCGQRGSAHSSGRD
jgi:hypothetical protein